MIFGLSFLTFFLISFAIYLIFSSSSLGFISFLSSLSLYFYTRDTFNLSRPEINGFIYTLFFDVCFFSTSASLSLLFSLIFFYFKPEFIIFSSISFPYISFCSTYSGEYWLLAKLWDLLSPSKLFFCWFREFFGVDYAATIGDVVEFPFSMVF